MRAINKARTLHMRLSDVNYQKPSKDLRQQIADKLMERYPPTMVESEGIPIETEAISSDMNISYYFSGIKVEISGERVSVSDTSTSHNTYRSLTSRLVLTLLYRYVCTKDLDAIIETKKRYRK